MASYDLRCRACDEPFEVFVQGFLKSEHRVCPECGSADVEQLFTGFMMGSVRSSDAVACASAPPSGCTSHGGFG